MSYNFKLCLCVSVINLSPSPPNANCFSGR
jgi:hypothetical protein